MALNFERVTFEEYLDRALNGEPPEGSRARGNRGTRRDRESSFYGVRSWEEATKLVNDGWEEGREYVGKILSDIQVADNYVNKAKVVHDVVGAFVDMGAFVSGEPECMMRRVKKPVKRKVARILVGLSASCAISAETLRWRGAAALALIDRLEETGIRCEVDMGLCNHVRASYWTIVANVKGASEPLHLDRMAFHLAHPASLRKIMWSFAEASDAKLANQHSFNGNGHYGMPVSEIGQHLPESEQYDLVVPGLQLRTVEEAIKKIEEMFAIVCNRTTLFESGPNRETDDDFDF